MGVQLELPETTSKKELRAQLIRAVEQLLMAGQMSAMDSMVKPRIAFTRILDEVFTRVR